MQPYGVPVSDENAGATGSFRGTETCNVAGCMASQIVLLRVSGNGHVADRVERTFLNATPAVVSRDFNTHVYDQSPNRIGEDVPGGGPFSYQETHWPLCCSASLNRMLLYYVSHMWMATYDNGLAVLHCGPCKVSAWVGDRVPVVLTCQANLTVERLPSSRVFSSASFQAERVGFGLELRLRSIQLVGVTESPNPALVDRNAARGRFKILIVDDSSVIRASIRRELADAFEIREASHGREALELIRGGFIPDLVTLDIEMPELNGFETCERLYSDEFRGRFPAAREGRVPVIFLTGHDTLSERRRGYELGALDFVTKQFEPGALAELVTRILNPGERLRDVHVLLVDDSPLIRRVVGSALRDEGVEVIEASDGLEGFTILCNRMSSLDLVITDIQMPVMTGPELCRRIRREIGLTDLPIVFFTGADQAQRLEAFQAGATDCLTKPFIKEEMIARLIVHIDKVRLSARLRRVVADLRSSMQSQRDMLATLSHDMRSPLAGIMGFADLLFMGPHRTPAELENLELIKQSGQMLLALVEDILALSRQRSGRDELALKPLELEPLLGRSVAMLRGLATRKRQEIVWEKNPGRATVAGHAESLLRVFNNLISNALKFTPEGGCIRVALDLALPGKVTVVVADTGIGIPAEKLARVFERYSGVSQKGTAGESSTGLGMSIVREFVEAHQGEITVASQPGRGTQFRITLPRIDSSAPAARQIAEPASAEMRHTQLRHLVHGRRVMVVDDNPVNHVVARAILANAGCIVHAAKSGEEALAALRQAGMAVDVVLMDMEMPGMDGLDATRAIRAEGLLALPVIALTGHAGASEREACRSAGMNDFLTKPFTAKSLLETIVRCGGPGPDSRSPE